jgi:hypothetical protein
MLSVVPAHPAADMRAPWLLEEDRAPDRQCPVAEREQCRREGMAFAISEPIQN